MKTTLSAIAVCIGSALFLSACGDGEARKLGFSSAEEMKKIHVLGWHTKERYEEDTAKEKGFSSAAAMKAEEARLETIRRTAAMEKARQAERERIEANKEAERLQEEAKKEELKRLAKADRDILTDIYFGHVTADKVALTHLKKRFEFVGQITGRTTVDGATLVEINNGQAVCYFTDRSQRLAVSEIKRSCWLWTGTLKSVIQGQLAFDNCSFRPCD